MINYDYNIILDFNLNNLKQINKRKSSYLKSYPFIIDFFQNIEIIKEKDFIIGSHLIYGWMPKVLIIDYTDIELTLSYLNKVKEGETLNSNELHFLKTKVNNSIVGVSKLLHFINPNLYAIWDSNIYETLYNKKKSDYQVNNVSNFIDYTSFVKFVSKKKEIEILKKRLELELGYNITTIRTVELALFMTKN